MGGSTRKEASLLNEPVVGALDERDFEMLLQKQDLADWAPRHAAELSSQAGATAADAAIDLTALREVSEQDIVRHSGMHSSSEWLWLLRNAPRSIFQLIEGESDLALGTWRQPRR